jgi:predicted XRE-type DNA-binding protein
MSNTNQGEVTVHTSYYRGSQAPGQESLAEFTFPEAWREYQDDRYGEEERLAREQTIARTLADSSIIKVVTILDTDGNKPLTTVFTLDVSTAINNTPSTADALNTSQDIGTVLSQEQLLLALRKLKEEGASTVLCIPAKNRLSQMAEDIAATAHTLNLTPETTLMFAWSGSVVITKADATYQDLYDYVLANI